jgi:Ca2+-binding RTX toxin-like protein
MPTFTGNNNNNTLNGSTGADDLYGAGGNDTLNAGDGNDSLFGGLGSDQLNGQNGDDSILGEGGNDNAFGGLGNDSLFGGAGTDSLNGGDGNDFLEGEAGNDTLNGGLGSDTVTYAYATGGVTVNLSTGTATVAATDVDTITLVENVIGSAQADNITGNAADNTITAGGGADTVATGVGSDTVFGGGGDDVIDAGVTNTATAQLDLNWTGFGGNGTNLAGGVSQNTGGVTVTASFTNDGAATGFTVNTNPSYVAGGETFNPNSNLYLQGTGAGNTSTTRIVFSGSATYADEVQNVQFRISDIDILSGTWQDVITITAYDSAGNPVPVTFTISGNDTVSGNTITAQSTSDAPNSALGSVLITIAGPVAWFEIDYNNVFTGGQVIYVSDIQFTAVPQDNDVVDAGDGNDTVSTGAGNDSILGGAGNDSLTAGDGNDTVNGGSGNDQLFGGFGNDTIFFGGGNDTVYGGDGDDLIDDTGADLVNFNLIYGGLGADTVWAGLDGDTVFGDGGADVLYGEEGNDSLSGDDGSDALYGGSGNDTLLGGDGSDLLQGDAGRDLLFGGAGADTMQGGADQDTIYGDIGDVVDGGSTGTDQDVLDLTAWGKALTNIYKDPMNPENGYVEFLDSLGAVIGTMTFSDIETIIPCFTPGTLILTERGEVPVEVLQPGDMVCTRDGGLHRVRWVGRKDLSLAELVMAPALRPVLIPAGALGAGVPSRDMRVSPQHRILVEGARAEMLFGEPQVLVAAIHLVGRAGIRQELTPGVGYIHVMFDAHEIICSDGLWSESFQPASRMVGGMDAARRAEIMALFPGLETSVIAFPSARLTLKAHEARVLLAA